MVSLGGIPPVRTRPVVSLALALAALAATGCITGSDPPSRELSTAQFDDVPAPPGFVLDASRGRSYAYAEGGAGACALRLGRMEYTGTGDSDAVLAWYSANMPRSVNGWGPAEPVEGGPDRARFRRGGEACLVVVHREGGRLRVVIERNTPAAQR
jgi:hypothetical protein